MKENRITAESLANGKVLQVLKSEFLTSRSKEALLPLLSCLRDSVVHVPVNLIISERDSIQLRSCRVGDYFTNQDEIRMEPDILKSPDNKLWFPMFSQKEQIPEDYGKGFSIVPLNVPRCLAIAHMREGVEGIVLDAFSESLALPFEIADIINEIPSQLSE